MGLKDLIRFSIKNALRFRRNHLLTVLGIGIGIATAMTISLLTSLGGETLKREVDNLRYTDLAVYKSSYISGNSARMDESLSEQMLKAVDGISEAMPLTIEYGSYAINRQSGAIVVMGVSEAVERVFRFDLLHGRSFTQNEVQNKKKLAIIDQKMAISAYGRDNIVGKEILLRIGGQDCSFRIIGVASEMQSGLNQLSGGRIPAFVYIPYTAVNQLASTEGVSQIAVQCMEGQDFSAKKAEILQFFQRVDHTGDVFAVENLAEIGTHLSDATDLIVLILNGIGAIALFVAGFGVMNTMLLSVRERQREIGIYRSVGGTKKSIVGMFLLEAVFLCLVGGLWGACTGTAVCFAVSAWTGAVVSAGALIKYAALAEGVAVCCGVLFGAAPAAKAAYYDPIQSIRQDGL